jgi:hypothetical protein
MADEKDLRPRTVVATVAPRRTVETPQGRFGPGKEVRLPAAEVERLRAGGFLLVPGEEVPPVDIGPRFSYEGPGVVRSA